MKRRLAIVLTAVMLFSTGTFLFTANAVSPYAAGDVNGDGSVGSDDARLALRASVRLERITKSSKAFSAADVNKDGEIKADDARIILRASVGLEKLSDGNTAPKTEFDYLSGGRCYYYGTMTLQNGDSVLSEVARTPDSLYMLFSGNGTVFATLTDRRGRYLISPARQAYLVVDEMIFNSLGELQGLFLDPDMFGFAGASLNDAIAVTTENVNKVSCKCYVFSASDGTTYRVYLDGEKLVRFGNFDARGARNMVFDIYYITDDVPADKITLPAAYKEYRGVSGAYAFSALHQ